MFPTNACWKTFVQKELAEVAHILTSFVALGGKSLTFSVSRLLQLFVPFSGDSGCITRVSSSHKFVGNLTCFTETVKMMSCKPI